METKESWEKGFDKKFVDNKLYTYDVLGDRKKCRGGWWKSEGVVNLDECATPSRVKSFIRETISQALSEFSQELRERFVSDMLVKTYGNALTQTIDWEIQQALKKLGVDKV